MGEFLVASKPSIEMVSITSAAMPADLSITRLRQSMPNRAMLITDLKAMFSLMFSNMM